MRSRMNMSGFTLIEMLVVIMIISILAAIGIPQYFKATEKARAAEATMLLGALHRSEQRYLTRWGVATSSATALDVEIPSDLKYFDAGTLKITLPEEERPTSYGISISRNDTEYNVLSNFGDIDTEKHVYEMQINNRGEFIEPTPPALK